MQPGTVLPLVSSPARSQSSKIHLKVLLQSKIVQATQPGPFGADINSLFLPLAAWHVSGPNLHRIWPTLYSREYNQIYRRSHRHYDAFKPIRHAVFSFTPHDCHVDVPLDSLPVGATEVSDGWRIIHPSSAFYPHKTITFSHTFRDYVDLLPDYGAMLIQRVDFQGLEIYETYDALISSFSLLLVSDGGADNSIGSTGWTVSADTGRRLIQGSGSVPGLDPRSYRAEGYAMVSGLTVLKQYPSSVAA
jgi:hypothetical protein